MPNSRIDKDYLKRELVEKLDKLYSQTMKSATIEQIYNALSVTVREILADKLRRHEAKTYGSGGKQVYYLSMEFLVGRSLKNNLYNLEINEAAEKLLEECGLKLEMLYDMEPDAGLGNGGLGRLAACYLDGLATQDYTATGYSILYEYGIFKQKIIAGWQQELADNWLPGGTVWLEKRADEAFEVRFDGEIKEHWYDGYHHIEHVGYNSVMAVPYDMYISGYDSSSVSKLRLWQSVSPGIDMDSFNRGDYTSALRANSTSELISKVLYPNDNHIEGKVLRLRQQYFLCSASINDIVQKHLAQYGTLDNLPKKIAVHINDTHPTLSIPELMRILLDECGYGWDDAMDIAKKTFAYTNHTVMSEALEKWNIDMFKTVLPRIYQIIEEIDRSLVRELSTRFPGDLGKASYMRILGDGNVRMANLCIYMSHSVNGVSKLHSDIIKEEIFRDFYLFSPEKFKNVTKSFKDKKVLDVASG
ncbi:MAG: glycogen/starch/alpha-glucan family phosphorylase, partial [Oscillospiraceae bacterium]